jgi:filamentous hemagglutinin family protein
MNAKAAQRDYIAARVSFLRRRLLPALIAGCFGPGALANPVGPQVINGQVGFSSQGNVLSVTNTPGAIINWQSFSINPGEITRFIQQNPNSGVLNRIVGQDPSQILGALQSNGRVFLINPNGILFGQGAQIDVNGLVASTLNISNEDFISGKLNFKAGDKAGNLKNQGAITTPAGGQVYLIAPNVENSGIITSPKGDVMLAAGHTVQLVDSMNPDLRVVLSAPEHEALNLGTIIAQGGKTGIYGALIKQRGIVSADSAVVGENGKIVFKASKETILDAGSKTTARGAGKGGEVQVLGESVGLVGDAKLDVSGQNGGGTVLVGGDYQGKNPEIPNAARTQIGKDVEIRADAIVSGDGGKVIVWSDEVTSIYGTISARGGEQGGNGGFVETSGKQKLVFNGRVDTSARNGKAGTLLLDPQDIVIANGSSAADDAALANNIVDSLDANSITDVTISEATLAGLSGNVTLQASRDVILNNLTDNVLDLPSVTSGSTFTVTAGRHITAADVNDRFQTGGGNVSFTTTNGKIDIGGIKSKGGAVTLSAGGALGDMVVREIVTTPTGGNGGNITLTSAGLMSLGGGNIDARGVTGSAGDVTLTSGGEINVQFSKLIYANRLKMSAAGGQGITDGQGSGGGPVSTQVSILNASNSGSGSIKISNAGGSLTIDDIGSTGYGIQQSASGGLVSVTNAAGNLLTVNAPVSTNNGTIYLTADKMALGATVSATGSNGRVELAPLTAGTLIDLGTSDTVDNTTRLELNVSELNKVVAPILAIGSPVSGAIDIKSALAGGTGGALKNVSTALSLSSGNTISQQFGATIDGGSAVKVQGTQVHLMEANGTGVVAGQATTGDFQYNSSSLLTVSTVDSQAGISSTAGAVVLKSTHASGINQSSGSVITAPGGLAVKAIGPVVLTNSGNNFATVAASMGAGSGNLLLYSNNSTGLDVGGNFVIDDVTVKGITTNNKSVGIGIAAGKTLTVSEAIAAGTGEVVLKTDNLALNNTITANLVQIRPVTTGRNITVGSSACASACLAVYDLYRIAAPTIGIGTDDSSNLPGAISVSGITVGGTTATDRNATTTRIGLLTGGAVTQTNPINVQDLGVVAGGAITLNAANQVTNFAAKTTGTAVAFTDTTAFNVTSMSGGTLANGTNYSLSGISTSNGNVTLTLSGTSASQLSIPGQIDAGTGTVTLLSSGSVYGTGTSPDIIGGVVDVTATGGSIDGGGGLHINSPRIASLSAPTSSINVLGFQGLTIGQATSTPGTVVNAGSTVTIKTNSPYPITVNGGITAVGNISLTAGTGSLASSSSTSLTINQPITSTSGTITLAANTVGGTSVPSGTNVTLQTFTGSTSSGGSSTPPPAPPTVDQCVTDPTTSGCSAVLPTLSTCTATPSTAGCSVVLPTISTCTTAPATEGCSAVLPTLSTCTAAPSTAGCSVVLPSVSTCTTAPTTEGCIAVLPPLNTCMTSPSTAGCSVVLPPLNTCIVTPSTAGCSAVLPSVSTCTTAPSTTGCSVVLPTLSTCTTAPTTAGCSAVLPVLSACTSTPTLEGCSAVLPSLSQCSAAPTTAGCEVVLPIASQCTLNPSAAGCTTVLPTTPTSDKEKVTETVILTTNTMVNSTLISQSATSSSQGGGSGASSGGGTSEKSESKKDDKKTTSGPEDNGAKKNEPAKKMYCN